MMNYKKIGIALFVGCMCISVSGQIPGLPVMPSPPTLSMPNYGGDMFGPKTSNPTPHQHQSTIRNNPHAAAMDMYERDRMEVERRNAMAMQEMDEDIRFFQQK